MADLPVDYIKTMLRVSVNEIKFRLIADSSPSSRLPPSSRLQERVLCCLFINTLSLTLRNGYDWWEVSLTVSHLALKDYTNEHPKLKYLLKGSEDLSRWVEMMNKRIDDSRGYHDKQDMIHIRLKYGNSLFIYGSVNNMDIFWNVSSILKIASFFDIPESSVSFPQKSR